MSQELKPCPFCGRTDLLGAEPQERGFLHIKCRACGASGAGRRAETEEEAVAAWNRRHEAQQPAQAAADARDAERWRYALSSENFAVCKWESVFGDLSHDWVPISETSEIDAALATHQQRQDGGEG